MVRGFQRPPPAVTKGLLPPFVRSWTDKIVHGLGTGAFQWLKLLQSMGTSKEALKGAHGNKGRKTWPSYGREGSG